MELEKVKITIMGMTPLLMHADSIEWADIMIEWQKDPDNKAKSKAGDDRTPPWRWIGCLNWDDPKTGVVTIPSEYIMRSIMGGAAGVPTGKGTKTFKEQSQSGLLCSEFHWPLVVREKTINMQDINACLKMKTFKENQEAALALGFSLFCKRAKVGQSKHIRVRPRFDDWMTTVEILITDEAITKKVLAQILEISGKRKGLGDWRPGAPTPGAFGMFKATIE
jgi:hypothetical protein